MGCLNSDDSFEHWFGNIHFSGPCNRSCYFCIGQHMMPLDSINNLGDWPLMNIDPFLELCAHKGVEDINLTGSNTDPFLYKMLAHMMFYIRDHKALEGIDIKLGVRTNGVKILEKPLEWNAFDKASISITSFDPDIYRETMGTGSPPDLETIRRFTEDDLWENVKINTVLCPENTPHDIRNTIARCSELGITKINLREPYGQPHIGNPLEDEDQKGTVFGMPLYEIEGVEIVYWDVHYVHVESVNLYANGVISMDYPVTRGHHPVHGEVKGQEHFTESGRVREQWVGV